MGLNIQVPHKDKVMNRHGVGEGPEEHAYGHCPEFCAMPPGVHTDAQVASMLTNFTGQRAQLRQRWLV